MWLRLDSLCGGAKDDKDTLENNGNLFELFGRHDLDINVVL
jgi:hypothetical protein